MRTTNLSLVKVAALAGTRAAMGVGIGLLVADRLDARTRTAVGSALFAFGLGTTVPLVVSVRKGIQPPVTPTA